MKRNSIIEAHTEYIAPSVIVMSLDSEGVICLSNTGGGGCFEPDEENPEIDF